jgi:hypothetical protein
MLTAASMAITSGVLDIETILSNIAILGAMLYSLRRFYRLENEIVKPRGLEKHFVGMFTLKPFVFYGKTVLVLVVLILTMNVVGNWPT